MCAIKYKTLREYGKQRSYPEQYAIREAFDRASTWEQRCYDNFSCHLENSLSDTVQRICDMRNDPLAVWESTDTQEVVNPDSEPYYIFARTSEEIVTCCRVDGKHNVKTAYHYALREIESSRYGYYGFNNNIYGWCNCNGLSSCGVSLDVDDLVAVARATSFRLRNLTPMACDNFADGFILLAQEYVQDATTPESTKDETEDRESVSASPESHLEKPVCPHGQNPSNLTAVSNADIAELTEIEPAEEDLEVLHQSLPSIPSGTQSIDAWIHVREFANRKGYEIDTLKTYRSNGKKTTDGKFGRDVKGNVWGRKGNSHTFYYDPEP